MDTQRARVQNLNKAVCIFTLSLIPLGKVMNPNILLNHHFPLLAQISSNLSFHSSLLSIASGRSSILHPVSEQSCSREVFVGRWTLAYPCEGVHWRGSLMSSSLFLQHYLTCFVRLIWKILEM